MTSSKIPRVPIIGMALFSMFFGSGNLIFPLSVGQFAQESSVYGMLGFLLTGVLVPFLGVITMVIYGGDYVRFFSCLGKRAGFFFVLILLTVWIPLGSGPRCITLCFANIKPYLSNSSLWSFSLVYCLLLFFFTVKKNRVFDLLGYVLTPLLLVCLSIIIFRGVHQSSGVGNTMHGKWTVVQEGLIEGYHTMDLIASFFFSSAIIAALRRVLPQGREDEPCPLNLALKSCLIGVFILGSVYVGLISLAAANSSMLVGMPKEELLAYLSAVLLGPELHAITTLAIALACMTTSIAMVLVYADYIKKELAKDRISYRTAVLITVAVSYGMSILGFKGITALTKPILEVFYPFLIFLMTINLAWKWKRSREVKRVRGLSHA